MCITWKVLIKLQNVYTVTCASWESCCNVGTCIYHHMCVTRKVVKLQNIYIITCARHGKLVQGCGVYISWHLHLKESSFKVGGYICEYMWITWKVVMITCARQGKLVQGCGEYISWRVHHKESCYKVAKCVYHHVCITRRVVIKLQNGYIITSASQTKLL